MKRIARCCCKDLSIEVVGLPLRHGVLYCNNCKRRSGKIFGILYFEDKIVHQAGILCMKKIASYLDIRKDIFVVDVELLCIGIAMLGTNWNRRRMFYGKSIA